MLKVWSTTAVHRLLRLTLEDCSQRMIDFKVSI